MMNLVKLVAEFCCCFLFDRFIFVFFSGCSIREKRLSLKFVVLHTVQKKTLLSVVDMFPKSETKDFKRHVTDDFFFQHFTSIDKFNLSSINHAQ